MGSFLNQVCSCFHILEGHILGTGNIDEHTTGSVDGGFHQRAGHCHAGCILCLALAAGMADAHVGKAGILHDAGDIRKVKVDEAGVFDQVGNAGDGLLQHIIRNFKCIGEGDLLVGGKLQPVIGDDEQRVYPGEEILNALICLVHALLAFKLEGLGHNTHREAACLAGNLGNHGACTGTCAAAHTGSDEHHVGILHSLGNVIAALFGSTLSDFRIGTGALATGDLLTDLYFLVRIGNSKCLLICIHSDKLDTLCSGFHHAVHNVIAGSADTDHLDGDNILRSCFRFKIHNQQPPSIFPKSNLIF